MICRKTFFPSIFLSNPPPLYLAYSNALVSMHLLETIRFGPTAWQSTPDVLASVFVWRSFGNISSIILLFKPPSLLLRSPLIVFAKAPLNGLLHSAEQTGQGDRLQPARIWKDGGQSRTLLSNPAACSCKISFLGHLENQFTPSFLCSNFHYLLAPFSLRPNYLASHFTE